jgi:hypothetical protein
MLLRRPYPSLIVLHLLVPHCNLSVRDVVIRRLRQGYQLSSADGFCTIHLCACFECTLELGIGK